MILMILIFDLQIFFSDYAYYDDLETDYDFLPSIRVPSSLECTRRVRLPQRVLRYPGLISEPLNNAGASTSTKYNFFFLSL